MTESFERLGYSVRGIANWILDYADELNVKHTNMGINKLVFFAVNHFLVYKDALLTNAKIEAWEHGPVFRELYQSFKKHGNGYVTTRARSFSAASEQFEEVALNIPDVYSAELRSALHSLMFRSASELRAISHRSGGAWAKVWWYQGRANPGMEITASHLLDSKNGSQP